MPIYEYKCNECDGTFEYFQSITEDPLDTCSLCGKQKCVSKIISTSGFRLKGSGWYETDFKNKTSKKSAKDKSDN